VHADKTSTIRFYKDRVKQLLRYDGFRKVLIDQIDEEAVAGFIKWRCQRTRTYALSKNRGTDKLGDTFQPVTIACVNRDLATLRRMLNVARLWKVILAAPLIKLLPGERSHERVLTHTEESQYLGAAPLLLRQFATIMLDTGMRPEEVCRMRWEHVHLEPLNGARFGFVHNPKGKTKLAKRNLSMTARVHSLLSMRHEEAGQPVAGWVFPSHDDSKEHTPYTTIDSQHGRTIEKLTAKDADGNPPQNAIVAFRLYDLRHTALTRLGEVNTDPYTLQCIAGHSSILISSRYVHPTPERLEDAFARLQTYNQGKGIQIPETSASPVN
jgi:integrase